MFECASRECSRGSSRECSREASREWSRERRGDGLLPHEHSNLSILSQSSDHRKTFSVVKRVEELSQQFNTLHDRLLRIEQKDPVSFQSSSINNQDYLFRLEDLRDRMNKLENDHRVSHNFHALKLLPEPPITPQSSQLHTPKFDSLVQSHTPRIDSLERQTQDQPRNLDDVTPTLSERGHKYDDVFESGLHPVFESKLHSAVGPLKEELAALQERVSQIPAGPSEKEFAALQERVSHILAGPWEKEFAALQERVSHILVGPLEREVAALQERVSQLSVLQQDAEEQELKKLRFARGLMYVKESVDGSAPQPPDVQDLRSAEIDCQKQTSLNKTDEGATPKGRARLEYRWKDSVWDVSILIGTEQMNSSSSLTAAMCLFCYLLLVGFLLSESVKATSQKSYDTNSRAEFSFWRSAVAHQVDLLDPVIGESLARGVCSQRLYLPYANLQLDTVQVLSDYLEVHPFIPSMYTGSFMCILVLFVWCIRLIHELALTLDLVSAIAMLPISPKTTFKQWSRDSLIELLSISKIRIVFLLTLQFCRVGVVIALGWSGSDFLIQETSVTDMLLNAVAMEFILDLDELIFEALLPKKPRRAFERLAPLKYELHHLWAWHRIGYIMLVLSIGVLNKFLVLDPYVTELENNLDALCGGVDDSSLDFVIAVDSIGIPWAAETSNSRTMFATYAQQAVSQAKDFGFPRTATQLLSNERTNFGPFMQIGSPSALEKRMRGPEFSYPRDWTTINAENVDYVVGWSEELVFGGTDFGDAQGTVYNRYLQFLLGVSWKVNCSNVPFLRCYESDDRAGLMFRKLCPTHCGCDAPTSGTVSSPWASHSHFGFQGCPEWVTRTRKFVKIIGDLPCEDASRSVFIRWLQGMGDVRHGDGVPLADQLLASFEIGGCAEVAKIKLGGSSVSRRICAESSLPAICPTSCGCDDTVSWRVAHRGREEYCPQSCGKNQSIHCHTVYVNHSSWTGETGPHAGLPCIFPFIYEGETYNNCITADWSGPWCYVTKREGQYHTWGDCPPGC